VKVLVVTNMAPFIWGGAEELAVHLQRNLVLAGHEAEVLRIPFQWEPATRIPSQMMMVRAFELWNVDHVIALKFPAYLIRHPHKTLWLVHQYRQAFDLFDAGHTNLTADSEGRTLREMIRRADNEGFSESRRIFTISEVTRRRLKKYNGFDSEVLLPPINDPELFAGGAPQGYIFAGGRINDMKRQYLLLDAMAKADRCVRLVIAGPPDAPNDREQLIRRVEELGLSDRVKLDLRFLPRAEYANYINDATAVAYLPIDEDSLGYVSMEAATARKALISATDSGGVLGLVKNAETGWVAQPNAESLAAAMNAVYENDTKTLAFGMAAKDLWDSMEANWPTTVEKLLR
tara:strand:+ start:29723 stop:30760 length:1038 start_codon:yes stop_codon:yes gene_type:complete